MAMLAALLRKPAPAVAGAERTGLVAVPARAPRLRPLPNEDVYFFSKRIDNSRIVREDNPQARGECWSAIGAGCAIVALVVSMLVPKLGGILIGYQIQALQQEHQRLLDERANLIVEEAALTSPDRLGQLAGSRGLSLVKPEPGQIVHLNSKADGALALIVEKQAR